MDRTLTWSYGGGTQSIAIAVLVAQGKLPAPKHTVIADTGREGTETWEYLDQYVAPLLAKVGVVVEVASHDLSYWDLTKGNDKKDMLMPLYTKEGALPPFCSNEWKKRVFRRYMNKLGYGQGNPIETWIGFSLDEIGRCAYSDVKWQEYTWPLIDLDKRIGGAMKRHDCRRIVLEAGLPEPPKSSCWMCPFRRNAQWRRLRDFYPEDFEKACLVDEQMRAHDISTGGSGVYVHDSRVPLREANLEEKDTPQLSLEGPTAECNSGMCWV